MARRKREHVVLKRIFANNPGTITGDDRVYIVVGSAADGKAAEKAILKDGTDGGRYCAGALLPEVKVKVERLERRELIPVKGEVSA